MRDDSSMMKELVSGPCRVPGWAGFVSELNTALTSQSFYGGPVPGECRKEGGTSCHTDPGPLLVMTS